LANVHIGEETVMSFDEFVEKMYEDSMKLMRSTPLPQQIEGDPSSTYTENEHDFINQAMVYVAMVDEERITRDEILTNVKRYFDVEMRRQTLVVTLLDLIKKGLARSIRPDDADANGEQQRTRIFLYELLET
jgi:hypothetical protein